MTTPGPAKSARAIVIFDRAYVDFVHLFELGVRAVSWVTRSKENLKLRVVKKRLRRPCGSILSDDEVVLINPNSRSAFLSGCAGSPPGSNSTAKRW